MPLEMNTRVDAQRTVNQMWLSEGGPVFEEANQRWWLQEPREINTYPRKYPFT